MRPRYGGTLRVKMQGAIRSLEPVERPASPSERTGKNRVTASIFEGLTRLGRAGTVEPCLAVSWQHDRDFSRWVLSLRPGVKLHGGSPLTPAIASDVLNVAMKGMRASVSGDSVVIQTERPDADLPRQLAQSQYSIFVRTADNQLAGTGPFRIDEWQAGRRIKLLAHEEHWAGRPFVDAVEIEMGRALREQLVDLELGKADLVEIAPNQVRGASQRGIPVISTLPTQLWALVFRRDSPSVQAERLRETLALSIDRASAHTVLLQKQGELSGGLLPQWLSGYVFLFSTARNLSQARTRIAGLPAPSLSFAYDTQDSVERSIAERVAVNAREAGVLLKATVEPAMAGAADVRLQRVPVASTHAGDALAQLARDLGLPPVEVPDGSTEALYQAEHALLKSFWVVPLFHLPSTYGLSQALKSAAGRISSSSDAVEWEFPPLELLWLSPPGTRGTL